MTRETLRYAQLLYLQDRVRRDYSVLPERLRPEFSENPDEIHPQAQTTLAGLLFRTLLDRFGGNVMTAVGAYNGGSGNPNASYAGLVRAVAAYSRKVITQSVIIDSMQSHPVNHCGRR